MTSEAANVLKTMALLALEEKMPPIRRPPQGRVAGGNQSSPSDQGSGGENQETETAAGDGLGTAAWWILAACIIPWAILEAFFYMKGQKAPKDTSNVETSTDQKEDSETTSANTDENAEDITEDETVDPAEKSDENAEDITEDETVQPASDENAEDNTSETVDQPKSDENAEDNTEDETVDPAEKSDENAEDGAEGENKTQEEAPTVAISKDSDDSSGEA